MNSQEVVPLGVLGIIVTILLTFFGSKLSAYGPYTTDLVRYSSFVYTDIAFGSQSFKVMVDTGSSDTWLTTSNFACFVNQKAHPQADCKVGPLYYIDDSFTEIPNEVLHAGYEPMTASGFSGMAPIGVAGLKAIAQVGVVNRLVRSRIQLHRA
jgi:hypothetical protein